MSSGVVIDRTRHRSSSSSILGSASAAIVTIQEEDSSANESISIHSENIDGVVTPPSNEEEAKPPKRLSFAPDPVQYRQARMAHVRTSRRGESSDENYDEIPEDNRSSNTFIAAVRRFTSVFHSSHYPSASDSATPNVSECTTSDRSGRRRAHATIFTRGSTTLSVASSTNDEVVVNEATNLTRENPCIKRSHYNAIKWMIDSRGWKYTCYLFIFIMLFGSQIQELWLPKAWDLGCDVVFTLSIVFLSLDVVFQSIVGK